MKIALYCGELGEGGAERVLLLLANAFASQCYAVDVLSINTDGIRYQSYAESHHENVRLICFGKKSVMGAVPCVISYLKKERPDVFMSTLDHVNVSVFLARLFCGKLKTRFVIRQANMISMSMAKERSFPEAVKARFIYALARRAYLSADGIIAVSKGCAEDLLRRTPLADDRVAVINNPVNLGEIEKKMEDESPALFDLFAPDKPVCISIGRLSEQKDFSTLIKAFSMLPEDGRGYLVILGEGGHRRKLEELVDCLGLDGEVFLPGFVENPYVWLARASIFALSSMWEGFPNVLLEALACGLPVVSTDCPSGPSDILTGNRFGRLVPVGDSEALAHALQNFMARNWPRREITKTVEKYGLEAISRSYLDFFIKIGGKE